jgi:fructose/tagatose bisphosphate aldolase
MPNRLCRRWSIWTFALISAARLEWIKFEAGGPAQVAAEFARWSKPDYVRLHLDHVPVIDEDDLQVDYLPIFHQAIQLGFESVMIDASRLSLEENIQAVRPVVQLAHAAGIPVEAELGAVMGHESGPLPSYEELYTSGRGFTDPAEAHRFIEETGCDWLSVAVATSTVPLPPSTKIFKKIGARLTWTACSCSTPAAIPLVLHGGSGIKVDNVRQAIKFGIAKINIATEIRQAYEAPETNEQRSDAQQAVYQRTRWVVDEFLGMAHPSQGYRGVTPPWDRSKHRGEKPSHFRRNHYGEAFQSRVEQSRPAQPGRTNGPVSRYPPGWDVEGSSRLPSVECIHRDRPAFSSQYRPGHGSIHLRV